MSARRKITQPSLFDVKPAAPVERPPDLDFIRKNMHYILRVARNAQFMPWGPADTRHWEKFFPELAELLPADEGAELVALFHAELSRLRGTN